MAIRWIDPVEITPGTASAWVDVDVSAYIPAGAAGVILHFENTSTTLHTTGWRKNGSTDNRRESKKNFHYWCAIGVDANRIFELNVGSATDVHVYLVGSFAEEAVFFTNAYQKSVSTGSWQDINISTETGADTAIGGVFEVFGGSYSLGLRKNGSTDNRKLQERHFGAIIGVDGSEICEGYTNYDAGGVGFFLVGYLTAEASFYTNATDISLTATSQWTDMPALPANATGAFIEVYTSGDYQYGLRKNGSAESIIRYPVADASSRHCWGMVQCDAGRVIEGYIANTAVDFFLTGYTTLIEKTASDLAAGADTHTVHEKSILDAAAGAEVSLLSLDGVDSAAAAEVSLLSLDGVDSAAAADATTGADCESFVLDSAIGLDICGGVGFVVVDLAAGAEGSKLSLAGVDSAAAADAATAVACELSAPDAAAGTETVIAAACEILMIDSGAGADALAIREMVILDSAAAADIHTISLAQTDSAAGAETVTDHEIIMIDSGAGAETVTDHEIVVIDSGAGADALAIRELLIVDSSAVVDSTTYPVARTEAATGAEGVPAFSFLLTDSSAVVELASPEVWLASTDLSSGVVEDAVLRSIFAQWDATAREPIALVLLQSDLSVAVEISSLTTAILVPDIVRGVDARTLMDGTNIKVVG